MPNSNELVCYLVNPPSVPIPLSRTREITIGRDSANRIVLPYQDVSRFHSKIHWENQKFIIEDLNSANGTLINGQQITLSELHDGDMISIGNNLLFFYEGNIPISQTKSHTETSVHDTIRINASTMRRKASDSALNGSLKTLNLPTVLQILGTEEKTGEFCLQTSLGIGKIYFYNGTIIHSAFLELQGIAAFFSIMDSVEGTFEFHEAISSPQITMNHPVEFLLLEYARRLDESTQVQG